MRCLSGVCDCCRQQQRRAYCHYVFHVLFPAMIMCYGRTLGIAPALRQLMTPRHIWNGAATLQNYNKIRGLVLIFLTSHDLVARIA